MKQVGIIGGSGAYATHYLLGKVFDYAVENNNAKADSDFPYVTVINSPFVGIDSNGKHNSGTYQAIIKHINQLQIMGCDIIAFACNTLNQFVEKLKNDFPHITFITLKDILEPVLYLKEKIGVMSSRASADLKLFSINDKNTFVYLDEDSQIILDSIIDNIISKTDMKNTNRQFNDLVIKLLNQGVNRIIVGCSELSIIKKRSHLLIDTMDLLAEKINFISQEGMRYESL